MIPRQPLLLYLWGYYRWRISRDRWLVDKLVACNKLISQDIKSADNVVIFVLVAINQLPVPTDITSTSSVNTEIVKK
jgi:hypothetical protein